MTSTMQEATNRKSSLRQKDQSTTANSQIHLSYIDSHQNQQSTLEYLRNKDSNPTLPKLQSHN